MADDVTLLPCPACWTTERPGHQARHGLHALFCSNCRLRTAWYPTREQAEAAWNTRVPDPRIAELEAEVEEVKRYHREGMAELMSRASSMSDCFREAVRRHEEAQARIADLEAQLAEARAWSSTLADTADDLRAELREAEERNAELEALSRPFPGTETCQLCGRAMGIGFHVDDDVWRQLNPSGDEHGVLCPWCADQKAKELGLTDVAATFFMAFDALRQSPMPHEAACYNRIEELEGQVALLTAALANAEGQNPETWAGT